MTLAVITPSYKNDWDLFADLHQSVLTHTDDSVKHYVIVPDGDVELFVQFKGPRCVIFPERALYPGHYWAPPFVNRLLHNVPRLPPHIRIAAVNLRRPFPPIRGWIMQQALKMEACRRVEADTLLVVDSDVILIRPVTEAALFQEGRPRFYRQPCAIDERLPRVVQWHEAARKLLGLPPPIIPAPNFVSSFNIWESRVLDKLLAHIEHISSRHWMDKITSQLTFSEWTLYGVFVDEFEESVATAATDLSLCHSYWDLDPLTPELAATFAAGVGPDDLAVLIQSKSRTPLAVRRAAVRPFHLLDEHHPRGHLVQQVGE
jgi:Family of unknown function (DUF6492)